MADEMAIEDIGRRAIELIPVVVLKMEFEGFWVGVCKLCGQQNGVSVTEPDGDALVYLSCPACPGRIKDGTMVWERVDPE